jgi:hypothetical protein
MTVAYDGWELQLQNTVEYYSSKLQLWTTAAPKLQL